jgi:hypothetical protein
VTHPAPRITGVYFRHGVVVITGCPVTIDGLPEDHPDQHNCDAMGCGSLEHVIARFPIEQANMAGIAQLQAVLRS